MNMRIVLPAAFALAACGSQPAAEPPLAGASIGGPFSLIDGNGRPFTDRNLAGRWRIMYFGYTFCPDVCPVDMQNIGAGLRIFEKQHPRLAAKVVPVFVTVDPERDTPAVVKEYVSAFHPRGVGLTGTAEAVDQAADAYRVPYAKRPPAPGGGYMVDHGRSAYLMDPDGKPVALLSADRNPEAVAAELRRWVT